MRKMHSNDESSGLTISICAKIIAVYSLLLAIVGSVGNTFGFLVCLRRSLRQTPTFVFTAFSFLSDIMSLYVWNLNHLFFAFFNFQLEEINYPVCVVATVIQCVALQYSAWLLVLMSVERYLSVKIKQWRKCYFKSKRAIVASGVMGLFIFTLNLVYAISIGFVNNENDSVNGSCMYTSVYPVYMKFHMSSYGLIPYILIAMSNLLLIRTIMPRSSVSITSGGEASAKRKVALSKLVMVMTTVFILATFPTNMLGAFFLDLILGRDYAWVLLFFFDCLAFSSHGLSFLTLFLTNKQFAKETKLLFGLKNRIIQS